MSTIAHATIVMERTYNAAPARVFQAWGDVEARKRWAAPADNGGSSITGYTVTSNPGA